MNRLREDLVEGLRREMKRRRKEEKTEMLVDTKYTTREMKRSLTNTDSVLQKRDRIEGMKAAEEKN